MFRSGYGEVASMDEDVAVWDRRLRVASVVGVRDVRPVIKLGWRSVIVKSTGEEE